MDMTKKWILEIVAMFCVMLGCYKASAESFYYENGKEGWSYDEETRVLIYYNSCDETNSFTYDVSEEDVWKIIKGEEFPTFEFHRGPRKLPDGEEVVIISRMPCRDYTNRR
jgi:hypothetical protein